MTYYHIWRAAEWLSNRKCVSPTDACFIIYVHTHSVFWTEFHRYQIVRALAAEGPAGRGNEFALSLRYPTDKYVCSVYIRYYYILLCTRRALAYWCPPPPRSRGAYLPRARVFVCVCMCAIRSTEIIQLVLCILMLTFCSFPESGFARVTIL